MQTRKRDYQEMQDSQTLPFVEVCDFLHQYNCSDPGLSELANRPPHSMHVRFCQGHPPLHVCRRLAKFLMHDKYVHTFNMTVATVWLIKERPEICRTIAAALAKNTAITRFALRDFHSENVLVILRTVCNHATIRKLHFRWFSQLWLNKADVVIPMLGCSTNLVQLDLSGNCMPTPVFVQLCKSLETNTSIRWLSFEDVNISDVHWPDMTPLADLLRTNTAIRSLNLHKFINEDENVAIVMAGLAANASLRHLSISRRYYDYLKLITLKLLADMLCHNKSLLYVELEWANTVKWPIEFPCSFDPEGKHGLMYTQRQSGYMENDDTLCIRRALVRNVRIQQEEVVLLACMANNHKTRAVPEHIFEDFRRFLCSRLLTDAQLQHEEDEEESKKTQAEKKIK